MGDKRMVELMKLLADMRTADETNGRYIKTVELMADIIRTVGLIELMANIRKIEPMKLMPDIHVRTVGLIELMNHIRTVSLV